MSQQSEAEVKGQPPSWMWGASGELLLNGANQSRSTVQLAQVTLPRPAVCTVYLQAEIFENTAPAGYVQQLTIKLFTGLGRITIPRSWTFNMQPAPLSPLEFTIPFMPAHAVQAEVTALGVNVLPANYLRLMCQLQLSPITQIPQDGQPLKFGMALPGEADGMDESMYEDLEETAPGAAELMRREQEAFGDEDGEDDELDDEEPAPRRVVVPRQYQRMIDQLSRRLGRVATMRDLDPGTRRRLMRAIERGA